MSKFDIPRIQAISSYYKWDWNKLYHILERVSVVVGEVILTILETNQDLPIRTVEYQQYNVTADVVMPLAQKHGFDPAEMTEILQALNPTVSLMIMRILQRYDPPKEGVK